MTSVQAPPPDEFSLLRGPALGAIAFGAAIGLMTALTEREGATATLVGLLFALFGGSLTGLVKPDAFKGAARDWVLAATGCIAAGIIFGLGIGLLLKSLDDVYLSSGRLDRQVAYIKKLQDSGIKFGAIEGKSVTDLVQSAHKSPLRLFSGPEGPPSEERIKTLLERIEQKKMAMKLDKESARRLDRLSESLKQMKEWQAFRSEMPDNLKKLQEDLKWSREALEVDVGGVINPLDAMIRELEKAKN
jgi:hypothetical protein